MSKRRLKWTEGGAASPLHSLEAFRDVSGPHNKNGPPRRAHASAVVDDTGATAVYVLPLPLIGMPLPLPGSL